MAHTCLDCYMLCHCNGDIDDIDWGEDSEEAQKCTHFLNPECSGYNDDDDDEYYTDTKTNIERLS